MKDARISGYFDTKYMTVLRIEQILYTFEDQKFANFINLEQVNWHSSFVSDHNYSVLWHSHQNPVVSLQTITFYCDWDNQKHEIKQFTQEQTTFLSVIVSDHHAKLDGSKHKINDIFLARHLYRKYTYFNNILSSTTWSHKKKKNNNY